MLEDLLNEGDPIPAFDFFGETFVLSPGLEEKGGGLVSFLAHGLAGHGVL